MRAWFRSRATRLLDHRPVLAEPGTNCGAPSRWLSCFRAATSALWAARPLKAVLRIDKSPIECRPETRLRLSHYPGSRCPKTAESRIAHLDRRIYCEGYIQFQFDAKGLPGRNCSNPRLGIRRSIACLPRRRRLALRISGERADQRKNVKNGPTTTAQPSADNPNIAIAA